MYRQLKSLYKTICLSRGKINAQWLTVCFGILDYQNNSAHLMLLPHHHYEGVGEEQRSCERGHCAAAAEYILNLP